MYYKLRYYLSTDIVKVPFLNAIATVIRMLTGMISVKIVAGIIGPPGIALVGQLNNFSQILISFSNGGIATGVTKYVAEHRNDKKTYVPYIATGFKLTLYISLVISLFLIVCSSWISRNILKSDGYSLVFILFGISFIFYSLNFFFIAIINGFQEFNKYVLVNISGSIVGLLFSIYLALQFGITGALIASVTFQSVVFGITLYLIRNSEWFRWENFTQPFKLGNLTSLSKYSLMAVASAITVPASQMIVRGYIVDLESVNTAGIWEGLNRITSMYLMVITTSLGVYFLPKIAQLKNDSEVHQEVMKVYKLIIPFLIISSLLIYVFRYWVIKVLFTQDFVSMESLFGTQLIGEDIRILGWVTGYLLLAKAMYKRYIFLELLNFTLLSTLNYWLISHYGVWGATVGQIIIYSIYFLISIWFFKNMFFLSSEEPSIHEKIY